MDFELSDRTKLLQEQITKFMDERVYPNEDLARRQVEESGDPHHFPEILKQLQAEARALGPRLLEHGSRHHPLSHAASTALQNDRVDAWPPWSGVRSRPSA